MTSGANESDLSNPRFGYDVVCAVTQSSVDATVKEYLGETTFPITKQVYIADDTGHSKAITWDAFMVASKGTDPLEVPATADPNNPSDPHAGSFANLGNARFLFGFAAQSGLPPGVPPYLLSTVALHANTNSVTYNMLCSTFQCVLFELGGGYVPHNSWTNFSQPSGSPWIFSAQISLQFEEMQNFNKLPANVQQAIQNAGGSMALSVQQLVFDLETAVLQSVPVMSGGNPFVRYHLQDTFLGIYFDQMKAAGKPLLYVSATSKEQDPSDFRPTSLEREVCPYVGTASPAESKQFSTLNYLCSSFGKPLLPPVQFTWDWVKAAQKQQTDGVLAINRNTFANWLGQKLMPIAVQNSFTPWTDASYSWFQNPKVHLQGQLLHSPTDNIPPPVPNMTITSSGSNVLNISYYAQHESTCPGGDVKLQPSYTAEVTFQGSQITITQRLACYLAVHVYSSSLDGNIVYHRITDTFDLGVSNGQLITKLNAGTMQDFSQHPSTNWFLEAFTDMNSIIEAVQNQASIATFTFGDIPSSTMQSFMFPGAKVFAFSDIQFSDNQDLIANIIYLDPSETEG